jgi:polyphosphate kinase
MDTQDIAPEVPMPPGSQTNRELAWLQFNERVLSEAAREDTPLLEQLKFISIFSTNLDEFFMVRLSGLMRLAEKQGISSTSSHEEIPVGEMLEGVSSKVRELLGECHRLLHSRVLVDMRQAGLAVLGLEELSAEELDGLRVHFVENIFPVLTPLAVDPAHPFPYLSNLSLYLAVHFHDLSPAGDPLLAFVEIPSRLQRFHFLEPRDGLKRCIPLEDIVRLNLGLLFPWTRVATASLVRVTRNLDYQLLEGEVQDLMRSIELELKDREQKFVLRLEIDEHLPAAVRDRLMTELDLEGVDVYEAPRFVGSADLRELLVQDLGLEHRDPPFNPRIHPVLAGKSDFFQVIRDSDVLLHHPYDSFVSVIEFVDQASKDEAVLAIKMTLYRGGGDSPLIESLIRAAERGKQVTVVIELKARFDEEKNISWARRLERSGAHVVFGFVGLKTHCKCLLVVRREREKLQHYVHLSTGNYNHATARIYTDLALLTTDPEISADVANLFNLLTGFNILGDRGSAVHMARLPEFKTLFVAPFSLRRALLKEIRREIESHARHGSGRIVLKMNALTDLALIRALYEASQSGVGVDLLVRGVCMLRPGVAHLSDRIRVRSVIDRFLEHSRVYWFANNGDPRVFLSSADMMTRNLDRRIEVAWPLRVKDHIIQVTSLLGVQLEDNTHGYELNSDGTYSRVLIPKGAAAVRSQKAFIDAARRVGLKSPEYDTAVKMKKGMRSQRRPKRGDRQKKSPKVKPSAVLERK